MALGSRAADVAAEKAASLERVTVEPVPPSAPSAPPAESAATRSARRLCCPIGRVLTLLTLAACCLCLGFVELHRLRQGAELQRQLAQLQLRLDRLEGDAAAADGPRLHATPNGGLTDIDDSTVVRSRRSVADPLRTVDGVPIIDEPYGLPRTPSQGLSLYGQLQAQSQPTVAPRVTTDHPSIQAHHRSSAAYVDRLGRVNPNVVTDARAPVAAASAPSGRRVNAPGDQKNLHRPSRVRTPERDDPERGEGGAGQKGKASELIRAGPDRRREDEARERQAAPVLEARGSPTSFVPPSSAGHHGGMKTGCVAAHFEGHVSQLSRKTSSYGGSEGNGRLRNANPDGMFADWRPASWMEEQRCEDNFRLYGGQVTVATPGLYYLYAQINYLEDNDINAFEIQVNARSVAKCIAMEASDLEEKINTCHTGAVTYLGPGDAVSIRDLEPNRYSILLGDRSFFGLVRLSASG